MAQIQRRKFSKEFKDSIVELVLQGGKSVAEVSRDNELHESSVHNWVRQAKIDRGDGPTGALTTEEKQELSALRKEVRELRRERDFLKDAAAYFAKERK